MRRHYPLVAYLDEPLTAKIRRLQHQVADLTGAHAALYQWAPHISVGSEVWLEQDQVETYLQQLAKATAHIKPFTIKIHDFGFIDHWTGGKLPGYTPYGVYLDVTVTPELQQLAEALKPVTDAWPNYFARPWPYHPHVTIAFKDLSETGYRQAKALLSGQSFNETTVISNFSLAQKSAAGPNVEVKRIPLG